GYAIASRSAAQHGATGMAGLPVCWPRAWEMQRWAASASRSLRTMAIPSAASLGLPLSWPPGRVVTAIAERCRAREKIAHRGAPADEAAITRHELLFYVEPGAWVRFKKLREELAHSIDALETRPIRRGTGVLEHGVLGHLREHAFDVMALQRRVESLHNSDRLIRHQN